MNHPEPASSRGFIAIRENAPDLPAYAHKTEGDAMSTATKAHKAVAFERGTSGDQGQHKGYAASCDTCDAVTFGGFRTKTEAKAALEHDHGNH